MGSGEDKVQRTRHAFLVAGAGLPDTLDCPNG